MIRFVFRFLGLWLLAGGFVALVVDGTRSIASSSLVLTPLGEAWFTLSEGSLTDFQQFVTRNTSAALWQSLGVPFLMAPLGAVLGVLGIVFLLIGRRRKTYARR